jgi:hypothetical protein
VHGIYHRWNEAEPEVQYGIRRQVVTEPPHQRIGRKTASSIIGLNRREQPQLEGVRNCNDISWKTFRLEIVKRANEMSSGLQKGNGEVGPLRNAERNCR